MKGFSVRNIRFMFQFAGEYDDCEIMKQLVSQIPWGHNILIIQRFLSRKERLWNVKKTIENGWSRSVLDTWISQYETAMLESLPDELIEEIEQEFQEE